MNIPFKIIIPCLFMISTFLFSVSAPPFPFEVEQPDGSKISVRMFGDEYYNWMETVDGYVINFVEDENIRGWYYSQLDENGNFTASKIFVTYPAPVDIDVPKHLREISPKVRSNIHSMGSSFHNLSSLNREAVTEEIRPLIFLVDFTDRDHEYSNSNFEQLFFADDLSLNTDFPEYYDRSVRDYYEEISNDELTISGNLASIVDWHRVEHEYSTYVDSDQGFGDGPNGISQSAKALVVEIAMDMKDVMDFSQFDGDSDGAVDVIILVIEGEGFHEQSDGHFWPHMASIPRTTQGLLEIDPSAPTNGGIFTIDGVTIEKYILIYEQYNHNEYDASDECIACSGYIHPIGTICHELGHVLGLPDLYDITHQGRGIGEWGLMGSGNWQIQTSPAYMSAWSRYRLGFIDPIILEDKTDFSLTIQPAEQNGDSEAFILPMNSNLPQEYIMIENRQDIGSDQYLAGTGMLVWHIDETITDQYPFGNEVNVNTAFYGVNLVQADGAGDLYTSTGRADATDVYPSDGVQNIYNIDLYSYDRDADGSVEEYGDSRIEILNIEENIQTKTISCIITNPNINGRILSHDAVNLGNFVAAGGPLWAGVLITSPDTSVLSGLMTILPPTPFALGNISDYDFNIYPGLLSNNEIPDEILYSSNTRDVEWSSDLSPDFGWVFLSLINENILLYKDEEYYIEFKYNGTNSYGEDFIYPYDPTSFSDSSFIRHDNHSVCTDAPYGDWNIRAVLSGQNCGVIETLKIWPGDTNGELVEGYFVVNEDDIIPIGLYYGHQGCYRHGDEYSWEAQPYPDGWIEEDAARADANGDGKVDIADVLVILVNWGEKVSETASNNSHGDDVQLSDQELEQYRDNFYQIYQSLSGSSEPAVMIRKKLEQLFGFGILPTEYILGQNYPNPFNPRTVIPYYVSDVGEAEVVVYDVLGRAVNTFVHSHNQAGWYEVVFNAENMSSGIYFYRLESDGVVVSKNKMLLLK